MSEEKKKRGTLKTVLIGTVLAFVVLWLGFYGYLKATEASAAKLPELRDGDLVFQTTSEPQALAIMLASDSLYTHMGFIKLTDDGPVVVEAVGPVMETPLQPWIERGVARRVTVARIRDLKPETAKAALKAATQYYGRGYDILFYFGNDEIYCSELVYEAYKDAGLELGTVQKLSELDLDNAAADKLFQSRWQRHPLCTDVTDYMACKEKLMDQTLITPQSMANDERLDVIYTNY